MKKLAIILSIFCCLFAIQTIMAQEPVATLEHSGTTQVFYGQNALTGAYNASVNGDQIYLSAGYFTPPTSIAKGVKIFGAGHFPIEGKQTQIAVGLLIGKGADSLRLEGLFINGDITYDGFYSINYVKVIRCKLKNAYFQSAFSISAKNYCSFEECFIAGSIEFSRYGNNFLLRNSIVQGVLSKVDGNALIDGNVFLINDLTNVNNSTFVQIENSILQNNICLATTNVFFNFGLIGTNTINKNIFVATNPSDVNQAGNYTGVTQTNIFVNQTGNAISYLQNYHLKNPGNYIGTNGSEVGLYGGLSFKENGVPSNPFIVSKTIAPATETNGDLQINITIEAQDN